MKPSALESNKPSALESNKPSAQESDLIQVRRSEVAEDSVMEETCTEVKPLSPTKDAPESEESKKSTPAKEAPTPSDATETQSVKLHFSAKESGKKTEPVAKVNEEMEDTDAEGDLAGEDSEQA